MCAFSCVHVCRYKSRGAAEGEGAANAAPEKAAQPPVLVLGATGNVGAATVQELSKKGIPTRAGVRDPSSNKAANLAGLDGVDVVKADMGEPDTLAAAMEGVAAMFVVTPGAENRADLVSTALTAAKAANVPHVVVISLPCVASDEAILFKTQFSAIEASVRDADIPFSLLRLPMFIDNQVRAWANVWMQGCLIGVGS